ncbi:MAG: hypothetical protein V7724_12180 [Sediminicola sp.]
MVYAQLDESILFKDLEEIENTDFRKTEERDLDNWDIEYKSDHYYEPRLEKAYTFLGHEISAASFFVSEDRKIQSFGLLIYTDDATGFYEKMVETYGEFAVCSPSGYYFQKHGITLPTEESEEAYRIINSIPVPILEDYKNTTSIKWNVIGEKPPLDQKIHLRIYNKPIEGQNFDHEGRKLRIVFERPIDDL